MVNARRKCTLTRDRVSFHSYSPSNIVNIVMISPIAPPKIRSSKARRLAAPVEADDGFATVVVTVSVLAGMVVPGMTVAGFVVPSVIVLPLTKFGALVSAAIVLGWIVVPGIVVV